MSGKLSFYHFALCSCSITSFCLWFAVALIFFKKTPPASLLLSHANHSAMERSVFSVSCSLFGGLVLLLGLSGTVTLLPPFYSRQLSSEQPNLSSLGGWLLTPQSKDRHIGSPSITLGCYRFLCKSRHCPIFSTLFVFVSLLSGSVCGKCTP